MTHSSVSVVIPSYNHEDFVCAAVDSALAGRSDDLEVVVIDDGSTDGSRDRLNRYRGDSRVHLIEQENRGAHAALNRGIDLCTGELVFILNSDDLFDPERIASLSERLERNPAVSLAVSWLQVIDADGADLGIKRAWHNMPPWPPSAPGPHLSDGGEPRLALLEGNYIATTSNLAFHRTLVTNGELRFLPLRYAHDWDFILSACHLGEIELIEEPLVRYRVHGANTIREGDETGRGPMRFEVLWVVARHAARLLRSTVDGDQDLGDALELFWRSAPTFGCDAILDQLLALRGDGIEPPTAYDALLDPGHPYRRRAIDMLEISEGRKIRD